MKSFANKNPCVCRCTRTRNTPVTVIAVFEAANVVAVVPVVVEPSVKAAAYMVEEACVCGSMVQR